MKNKLLLVAMGFALTTQMVMAQVPSYVPTNGLVGYWPFNGNANDESGNGNNGILLNGISLTLDRFSMLNSAYNIDGVNCINSRGITLPVSMNNSNEYSISIWYKVNDINKSNQTILSTNPHNIISLNYNHPQSPNLLGGYIGDGTNWIVGGWGNQNSFQLADYSIWHNVVIVKSVSGVNYYSDGALIRNQPISSSFGNSNFNFNIGSINFNGGIWCYEVFSGNLDDVGIWNRALTQQEITNLYNSTSTSECLTMIINTGVLSTSPVTYTSTVNIYPNPANDQITIDCGNLANVVGWNIKITNMLGQEVFNQPMNTQQYVVPLNSWTGQGMYFVKIINAQNEVVNIKKIILQ